MVHDTTRRRDKNSHTGLHRANLPPPARRTVPRHTPALRRSPTAPDAGKRRAMSASNVAVIGAGSARLIDSLSARAAVVDQFLQIGALFWGGRTEKMEDGTELRFDHGAPYFTVSNDEVARVVSGWEARGIVAEWKAMFACFDRATGKFTDFEKTEGQMHLCSYMLCLVLGVLAKFGVTVGKMDWLHDRNSWSLVSLDGKDLGYFDYVVATDKNIASPRFSGLTGRPPPLDLSSFPQLSIMAQDIPVRPRFALMVAFSEPLAKVPVHGFSFNNSDFLSWAFCDSTKPGRACVPSNRQSWVLHSTAEYASKVINDIGPRKPSADALAKVAEELFKEFQSTGLNIPQPIFMKAHRWSVSQTCLTGSGGAFPSISIGGDDKCVWDKSTKLVICGDFCASPNVEGAILSAMRGASKIIGCLNCPSGL
ncbi:hypothetical protein PR202_gb10733 [Eleusine coracana subsp. coracana]|uniref:Amine oxidase domain-containing protein n=1 Tax=Eleusine coracana subsp. coracana TaxID=191504 RepID=A0AAV5EID4_ELECO|nr:hypothetical protein PR202_gb10733 [Eleusine coracana subsp. coracana]